MGISGEVIRLVRNRRHLSQTEFAREMGVSRTAVADWEQGKARISPENEQKLRDKYGAEVDKPVTVGVHSSNVSELRIGPFRDDFLARLNDFIAYNAQGGIDFAEKV